MSCAVDLSHPVQRAGHWLWVPEQSAPQRATVMGYQSPSAHHRPASTTIACNPLLCQPLQTPGSICLDFIRCLCTAKGTHLNELCLQG